MNFVQICIDGGTKKGHKVEKRGTFCSCFIPCAKMLS